MSATKFIIPISKTHYYVIFHLYNIMNIPVAYIIEGISLLMAASNCCSIHGKSEYIINAGTWFSRKQNHIDIIINYQKSHTCKWHMYKFLSNNYTCIWSLQVVTLKWFIFLQQTLNVILPLSIKIMLSHVSVLVILKQ